jgi:GH15 family glucan-1,4-alpha-glucosidase
VSDTPIADHALLSNCRSSALVDRAGEIVWLTFPRFDGPSVFARLLDDAAGHWSIRPTGDHTVTRRYLDRTMVLETTSTTASGDVVLTDALALRPESTGHAHGTGSPDLLVRVLTCTRGRVEVQVDYAPRPEYGRVVPLLSQVPGGITARGGADWLVLTTPLPLVVDAAAAGGRAALVEGDTLAFALHRSTLEQDPARTWAAEEITAVLDGTVAAWRSWSDLHQSYDGPWADLVHGSGRLLRALTYTPSGAIVAAPTTSLPEAIGGERNWDYRYSWVRDASFTMEALWVAACPDEAREFFAFMTTAAAASVGPEHALQIVFGVGGEHDLTERELPHLSGWRGSAPVRVGNGAWDQRQVDVYGELMSAAHRLRDQLGELDDDIRRFLVAVADAAAVHWKEEDQGIWEVRGSARHFLYSKLMCWVALDRAVELADVIGGTRHVERWAGVRDEIREAVLRDGWNEEAGAFTQSFGSPALDASTLMVSIVGFLPPDDPRVLATIDATEARLTDGRGLVYRYVTEGGDDGLAGDEGTFLLCTFWLAHALALSDQVERARDVFERAVASVNDVGLLAEEVDPVTGELLGNFPQAFSHIGLVNAAWAIAQAERRAARAG